MGCNERDFVDLKPYTGLPIRGIGGSILPKKVGTMVLRTMADIKPATVTFRNAVLCPDLGVNLISTDIIDRLGGKSPSIVVMQLLRDLVKPSMHTAIGDFCTCSYRAFRVTD